MSARPTTTTAASGDRRERRGRLAGSVVRYAQRALYAAGLDGLVAQLKSLNSTLFARVAIDATEPPRVLPLRDGEALKARFRAAIGADPRPAASP